jgi:hypothetical protein
MKNEEFADFFPPWLDKYLHDLPPEERDQFEKDYQSGVIEMLKELEKLPLNQFSDGADHGTFNARLGNTKFFINLKEVSWTAAKYGGPLVLACIFAPALLAQIGIVVTHPTIMAGLGSSVAAVYESFAALNASEMDTYSAVAAAVSRNAFKILGNQGASLEEVEESFRRDKSLMKPHSLLPMLNQLKDKRVIESKVLGGIDQYFLSF